MRDYLDELKEVGSRPLTGQHHSLSWDVETPEEQGVT